MTIRSPLVRAASSEDEKVMTPKPTRSSALVLHLIVGLALLGWPAIGSAAGTWSVISLPQQPGEVSAPTAVSVDAAGQLYVVDGSSGGRIQQRDLRGQWSVLATGTAILAIAADAQGNLYAAFLDGRIQKRDSRGEWSVITPQDSATLDPPISNPTSLAVDAVGNLYVAESPGFYVGSNRVLKRDPQGNWSTLATEGDAAGQVTGVHALALDTKGNLYVADSPAPDYSGRIQKRDAQGAWTVLAAHEADVLAVDRAGDLYVSNGRMIERRDAQGGWSVVAEEGLRRGQVADPTGLAVDSSDTLYVTDWNRVQQQNAHGAWSVIATLGTAPGQFRRPAGVAVDGAGNVYVAEDTIQKRDLRGNWSLVAPAGTGLGQNNTNLASLAVDAAGNLYVADASRIQKRDARGNWSLIAFPGIDLSRVLGFGSIAVDRVGNLYVSIGFADGTSRIQKRDPQGVWSVLANLSGALAADGEGNLYVVNGDGIQKRDAQGVWSVVAAPQGSTGYLGAVATDPAGILYVTDGIDRSQVHQRDTRGRWTLIAGYGHEPGQLWWPVSLAVDAAGSLYVSDTGNQRVQEYTPGP